MKADVLKKSVSLTLWSLLAVSLTFILSGAPLLALRRLMGSIPYWALTLGLSLTFWGLQLQLLAVAFLTTACLLGFFVEYEKLQLPIFPTSVLACGSAFLVSSSLFFVWAANRGKGWFDEALGFVNNVLQTARITIPEGTDGADTLVLAKEILTQSPGILMIGLGLTLMIALLFEKRIHEWARLPTIKRESFYDFRLPEPLIWVFILALLGAFANIGQDSLVIWIKGISANLFNICVFLYFLQGLSVICNLFEKMGLTYFWRVLWLTLLALQLFLVVGLIGVLDYWVDFRERYIKKTTKLKNT